MWPNPVDLDWARWLTLYGPSTDNVPKPCWSETGPLTKDGSDHTSRIIEGAQYRLGRPNRHNAWTMDIISSSQCDVSVCQQDSTTSLFRGSTFFASSLLRIFVNNHSYRIWPRSCLREGSLWYLWCLFWKAIITMVLCVYTGWKQWFIERSPLCRQNIAEICKGVTSLG